MNANLSTAELRLVILLCNKGFTAGELAVALKVKASFVSRLLSRLVQLNLVSVQKQGTRKIISLSSASHAQVFKKLYSSRPALGVEKLFLGKAIEILIPLTGGELTYRELKSEINCSRSTFFKIKKRLGGVGALNEVNGKYSIPDPLVMEFITQYADNLQIILQKGLVGFTVSKRIGKHVLVKTESEKVPEYFVPTGMTRLVAEGLQIIGSGQQEYCFNLNEEARKIPIEEAFVHALALSSLQSRSEFILLGIFLKQSGSTLNPILLRKAAKKYGVEKELAEIRRTLDLSEKLREYNA
ncbi:MAG: winged helix-turn-helix domain-containing protein [Candidatus Micrarchaeota archaeon]|nr:winged helix-turn-helix domain-containing protein [Candidatus Micrarchaeota archaeon]